MHALPVSHHNRFVPPQAEEQQLEALGLHEARSLPTDGSITRLVKRNLIYQRKAHEFALVHQELADWYEKFIGTIDAIQTGCSFALTVVLFMPTPVALATLIDNGVAIATLVLGVLKSWVTIAGYDVLQAKHETAARGFGDVEENVTSFLATLADVPGDDLKAAFADPHADDPERGDDAAQAKAASKALVSFAKLSPGECLDKLKEKAGGSFEQDNDHSEEEKKDGENAGQVVSRLRTMYRKSLEYRVAHALFESKYLAVSAAFSFVHLLLSSSVSAVLFLKRIIPFSTVISLVLSTMLTGLNTAIGALGLAEKAEQHTAARLAFASTQRNFATTLMLDPPEEIQKRFHEYAANWNQTLANTEKIKPVQLQMLRDEDNDKLPLLPLITPPILDAKAMKAATKAKAAKVKQFGEQKAAEAEAAKAAEAAGVAKQTPASEEMTAAGMTEVDVAKQPPASVEMTEAGMTEVDVAKQPPASVEMTGAAMTEVDIVIDARSEI